MKKKIILSGTIFISLLLILIISKTLNVNKSHAEPINNDTISSNKLYDIVEYETIDNEKGLKYNGAHADSYDRSGTHDIYYYTTPDDNFVEFAGKCWQIIRTTDTGGVKMIYSGVYDKSNKCRVDYSDKTKGHIGFTHYNKDSEIDVYDNLSYLNGTFPYSVGYMFNKDIYNQIVSGGSDKPDDGALTGHDVIYSDGVYTLIDTSTTIDNQHHYSCNNTTGQCESVRYYYYTESNYLNIYYVEIANVDNIQNLVDNMLYADNVNSDNSIIKSKVDSWYSDNLIDYDMFIEDTVYCNDRMQINPNENGWNIDGDLQTKMLFKNYNQQNNDLDCVNETDRFSVLNEKAHLTYKVGLPSLPELLLTYKNLNYSTPYFSMTPSHSSGRSISPNIFNIMYDVKYIMRIEYIINSINSGAVCCEYSSIRPVISLVPWIKYISGDGTQMNPYVVDTRPMIATEVENGSIDETTSVEEGSNKTIEYTANEGYRLKSILIDNEEVDISLYPDSYIFENITSYHTIKVIYEEIPKYNVTFILEEGIELQTQEVSEENLVIKPEDPTKEGYIFKYWSDEEGNEFNFDTPITKDIVLSAAWEEKEDTPSGEITPPVDDTPKEEASVPEQAKEETKMFQGTKPDRVKTPLTLDRVLTYVEIAVASLVLSFVMVMVVRRIKRKV